MKDAKLIPVPFAERRKQLLRKIKGAVAIFPSAQEMIRNSDVFFDFRQESNFYYLSGFEEPQSLLLFAPHSKTPFQMFVQPKDKLKELYGGKIYGAEAAKKRFGADAAFSMLDTAKFEEQFTEAMKQADRLYYRVGVNPALDQKIFGLLSRAMIKLGRTGRPLWPILDPVDIVGEMRAVKGKAELQRMEKAAAITAHALKGIMQFVRPGMFEYEVEAAMFHEFRRTGAARLAYPSIVAAGANACCLHYVANDRKMKSSDLLLIDAGAEYDYLGADITRTFPVGGTYSREQREVYSAVLRAEKECIKLVRPGKTLLEIHNCAVRILVEEMRKLKILKGTTKEIIEKQSHRAFFPHRTSHWLGMDVHDVGRYYTGSYDVSRKLEPGMVFTIEPGLYFSDAKSPDKYKGIGVRIEDDILVTQKGYRILTDAVPKEIDEIQALCLRPHRP